MSQSLSPWVYPVWNSLCLLDLIDYFFSHVREVCEYILCEYFLRPFPFSSSSGTCIIRMLVRLMLSQRSLRQSSILFILLSLFCSLAVISTILSFSSLIHSSPSVILLLIPSSVFLISVIVLFITDFWSLLNVSFIFSILFRRSWIIFIIIPLNSFSDSLPISSSFIWSCRILPCSFACCIFLCHFILSNLLCLWSSFDRLQSRRSSCFCCLPISE